jgi:hypothetical protein
MIAQAIKKQLEATGLHLSQAQATALITHLATSAGAIRARATLLDMQKSLNYFKAAVMHITGKPCDSAMLSAIKAREAQHPFILCNEDSLSVKYSDTASITLIKKGWAKEQTYLHQVLRITTLICAQQKLPAEQTQRICQRLLTATDPLTLTLAFASVHQLVATNQLNTWITAARLTATAAASAAPSSTAGRNPSTTAATQTRQRPTNSTNHSTGIFQPSAEDSISLLDGIVDTDDFDPNLNPDLDPDLDLQDTADDPDITMRPRSP